MPPPALPELPGSHPEIDAGIARVVELEELIADAGARYEVAFLEWLNAPEDLERLQAEQHEAKADRQRYETEKRELLARLQVMCDGQREEALREKEQCQDRQREILRDVGLDPNRLEHYQTYGLPERRPRALRRGHVPQQARSRARQSHRTQPGHRRTRSTRAGPDDDPGPGEPPADPSGGAR